MFDLKFLKSVFHGLVSPRRQPHAGRATKLATFLLVDVDTVIDEMKAATCSEARAMFKARRAIQGRLPLRLTVETVPSRTGEGIPLEAPPKCVIRPQKRNGRWKPSRAPSRRAS